MPRCKGCGNDKEFIVAYVEFEVAIFDGDKVIDNYVGDRERLDRIYQPECKVCGNTNIQGEI